jgi:hypothetical protein
MIEVTFDKKSPTLIITRTDSEGFHRQLQITKEESYELYSLLYKKLF